MMIGLPKLEKKPEDIFIDKTLRVFISYSDKDISIAKSIKEALNHFSIKSFLAHEDIPPGEEDWTKTLFREIKQADVFLLLLSKECKGSEWIDQETGIAVALKNLIIPVSIDGQMPYGFIGKYQAFRNFKYSIRKDKAGKEIVFCREEVFKIVEFIAKRKKVVDNLKDCLITSLRNAWTYEEAQNIMRVLMMLSPFSRGQANEIVINSVYNNQVHDASECKMMYLPPFLKHYGPLIEKENLEKIRELINQK